MLNNFSLPKIITLEKQVSVLGFFLIILISMAVEGIVLKYIRLKLSWILTDGSEYDFKRIYMFGSVLQRYCQSDSF